MPKPRTPTNLLELKGAFKKNPNRARPEEPEPTAGLGNAPKRFDKDHKAIWKELSEQFEMCNLGNSDRVALEALCSLVAEFREALRDFTAAKLGKMLSLIGLFGGTPADRSKISVGKKKGGNAFADF